jgi:hypothetical protein
MSNLQNIIKKVKMTIKFLTIKLLTFFLFVSFVTCKSQFTRWENNKIISNIEFEKVRYKLAKHDTILIIAYLKKDTLIEGYSCASGLVHFTKNFKLRLFKLANPYKLDNYEIQKDTWVSLERNGYYICTLPKDSVIQGYMCLGGKNDEGSKVSFDTKGRLHSFFSPSDIKIGNIFCAGGKSNEIGLLKNGTLGYCTLSIDHNINDVKYKRGLIVYFDFNGNVSSVKEK